mmetsp:Transcript_30438/g.36172  ORF Transcript_30438/g.36172 Transcript_30438/m.36172 type:complete len:88 (+) Transcript_30438:670-933(+)
MCRFPCQSYNTNEMKLKAVIELATERQADWQKWRIQSINILEAHINNEATCLLLNESPWGGMVALQHIAEITLKKSNESSTIPSTIA